VTGPRREPAPGGSRGASRAWAVLAVAYVGLIFFVSSRPYLQAPGPEFAMKDKLAHASEYAILGALLARLLAGRGLRPLVISLLMVAAIGASVAAADEMFQGTVPGRQRDPADWIADVCGVTAGAATMLLLDRRGRRPEGEAA
jgi:VanZ family protein